MDAGYKNTLGSSNMGSYYRYRLYSRYETVFQKMVLISGVLIIGIDCIPIFAEYSCAKVLLYDMINYLSIN